MLDYRYEMNGPDDSINGFASYRIRENRTDLVVKEKASHMEAKDLTRRLNFGGGFAGWTPEFFTQRFDVTI